MRRHPVIQTWASQASHQPDSWSLVTDQS